MAMNMTYLIASGIMGLLTLFGWKLTAVGAYETAAYQVIESEGEFEIREYPELALVATRTSGDRRGDDGSFMRLFRYIEGENEAQQKIAMTTPVFMQPRNEKADSSMAFVLPRKVVADGTPRPESEQVALQTRAGGRFAVIRFSGRLSEKSFQEAEQRLRAWMEQRGTPSSAAAETAVYNPPWTPGPLRRNEVLIRIP